jgi:GDP-4-dehydro-6-deoxy-D-mannose reductase
MRSMVTGGTGFLGSYMTRFLHERGDEVLSTRLPGDPSPPVLTTTGVRYVDLDVRDAGAVGRTIADFRPDQVYHYAGQAFVMRSWQDPTLTYETNLLGTLHVLDAVRALGDGPVVGFAGSGTEYGAPQQIPTTEAAEFSPRSPYAASKVAADQLCQLYAERYGVRVMIYRIFGTTGPGKTGDSSNDFASQVAAFEVAGTDGVLRVGNTDTRRDISDVRDAVKAMALVVGKGTPGGAYNIANGAARSIRENVDLLLGLSRVKIRIEPDPTRLRPLDEPVHWADVTKVRALGWSPQYSYRQTMTDLLEHWRAVHRAG